MSRGRRIVVAVFAAGALAALVVTIVTLSSPLVRARYHLRFASPGEVGLTAELGGTHTGHARAFLQSPAKMELLVPDLVELALAEAERDDGVCYRELVFELASGPEPRPKLDMEWVDTRGGASPPPPRTAVEQRPEVLRVMLACLRSKNAYFRAWALERLPLDRRTVEGVAGHVRWLAREKQADGGEMRALLRWLDELALSNQGLVQQEKNVITLNGPGNIGGLNLPDRGWDFRIELDSFAESATELSKWLDKHRSKLPPQILR